MKRLLAALMLLAGWNLVADDNAVVNAKPDGVMHFDFQLPDAVEMPNGEIYHHPKIVDVQPNGITIMHDDGAAFWPFSQLPDAIRNKFHYNPAAAQKYTDEMLLRREKIDEAKAKQQIADADQKVYWDLVSQRYTCSYLKMQLDAAQRQVNADAQNLKQIGTNLAQDRQVLSAAADQPPEPENTTDGFWNITNAGNNDNDDRDHVIGEFDEDWQNNKTNYEMWTTAKSAMEENLTTYRQEYQEGLARLHQLEAQWADIQQRRHLDEAKLNKQIHESVQQEVQNSMIELQKLRDMRKQNLITQDEYINEKAKILKRF